MEIQSIPTEPAVIEPALPLVPIENVSCPTNVQTNSSEVNNVSPQTINAPGTSMQLTGSQSQYYINPNMSNCTVNFHFNGN